MGVKGKALAAVVATVVTSAVGVAGASAETGGHFTSDVSHMALSGSASGSHGTDLRLRAEDTPIECASESYTGTANATTVPELALSPTFSTCKTAGGESNVLIDINGCSFVFKIGKKANQDNTVELTCPAGNAIVVTHPNCTATVPPQTLKGAAYTGITEGGKAALTIDWTASVSVQFHGQICVFLGTNNTGSLAGSFVLTGKDTAGAAVGIEATGTEDGRFRFEATHTGLTGTQTTASKTTFGALLGTVECSTATLDGTSAATGVAQITVIPTYAGCTGTGRVATTHTNGCAYVLTVTGAGADGQVDIECPAGKSIETTIDKFPGGCTITVPAQTAGGVVDYKEEGVGTGRDLLLTWTLEGLHYTRDGCEVGGTGNNGTMSGSITLSGEDTSGNPKGIWVE
jgi:hypothetical protein